MSKKVITQLTREQFIAQSKDKALAEALLTITNNDVNLAYRSMYRVEQTGRRSEGIAESLPPAKRIPLLVERAFEKQHIKKAEVATTVDKEYELNGKAVADFTMTSHGLTEKVTAMPTSRACKNVEGHARRFAEKVNYKRAAELAKAKVVKTSDKSSK